MTRKLAIAVVMILGVLVICALGTGCAAPYTVNARVTAKNYWKAHTYVTMAPVVIFHHVPEQWTLTVAWVDNERPGRTKWTMRVDQATYDRMAVGAQVQLVINPGWSVDLADPGR